MIRPLTSRRRLAAKRMQRLLGSRKNSRRGRSRGLPAMTTSPIEQQPSPMRGQQKEAMAGQTGSFMNNGGNQDLPPMQGNPYSPSGGNGMDNLNNMIKRNRPKYY